MTNYLELSQKPSRFLSLTCYTVEEFQELLPYFNLSFQEYMENFTFEGKKRKRKYLEYKNSPLLTIENKLLFILIYLKVNCLQETLAEMFDMCQPKANVWIHLLHNVLSQTLEQINLLPTRNAETLKNRLANKVEATSGLSETPSGLSETPSGLSEAASGLSEAISGLAEISVEETDLEVRIFWHDGTDRPINRPLDYEIQPIYYSGKQKRHTIKNNMVIDCSGNIIFLSETTEGKKHDKKIADEAGYRLPEGSILYQDTGFQGLSMPEVKIIQPKKKHRGKELTSSEKETNRAISSIRVRIEHAIGSVKRYRIVKDTLRNWKKYFKDKVLETCCGLHNFRLRFRPWCYETVPI
jgi:hypothetical protein